MSKTNSELTAKIKQNRQYVKEAQRALAEVKKTIRRGRSGHSIEAIDYQQLSGPMLKKEQALSKEDLGRFISARNGKGWLKRRI